ncbi:O-antigen ligase family protein [Aerococcus urinae]|uniref:O-antigen ligase family protein n=1 Tax=Aerococcus urinae TaxID=1376 RepID=UPI002551895B|nr:O-antigen ligase family protein [Aerococcus urinae]MDK8132793.1 O-antigen ligase family protein [Aerococcus urinae]
MTYLLEDGKAFLPGAIQSILMTILLVSLFFPFYITIVVFGVVFTLLLATGMLSAKHWPDDPLITSLFSFPFYAFLISIVHENWVGGLISVGLLIALIYSIYYTKQVRPDYLTEIVNITLIASIIIFIFTLLEHFDIISEWDYTFISPAMNKVHPDRVEATFFNPNYFAMMLEFFIVIAMYRMKTTKHLAKKLTCLFLIACNLLAIVYTGCRTSAIVIIGASYVFFYVIGYKKTAIYSLLGLSILGLIAWGMGLMPRFDDLAYAFSDRFDIWQTGWQAFKDNVWFGQGPLTYMHVYSEYTTKYTQHAHNIFLDTLLSYGIIESSLLVYPLYRLGRMLNEMRRYASIRPELALICSLLSVVLIHGLTDVTIFWIQTAGLLMAIVLVGPNLLKTAKEKANHLEE